MRKQIEAAPDELKKLGYEERDISLPILIRSLAGLFIFLGVSSIIALIIFNIFVPHEQGLATPASEQSSELKQMPPEPRVQANPVQDMHEFRAKEEAQLNAYAWKDKTKGTVQIPVDHAIDLMADRLKVGSANGQ